MISPQLLTIIGVIALGIFFLIQLKKNFSERLFLKIGMWLFLIQGGSSTYGLYLEYSIVPLWATIARLGSIGFNFLIAYFFYWLMNKAPASMGGAGTTLTPEQINEFLETEVKKK
jgi:hypothetical protein